MKRASITQFMGLARVLDSGSGGRDRWLSLPSRQTQRHMVASGRCEVDGSIYQSLLSGGAMGGGRFSGMQRAD